MFTFFVIIAEGRRKKEEAIKPRISAIKIRRLGFLPQPNLVPGLSIAQTNRQEIV